MPIASLERNPGNISLTGATVGIDPYAAGTQVPDAGHLTEGTHNIAAGKYKVFIKNEGVIDFTVNAKTISPEAEWEISSFENPVTQKLDLTPSVEIIIPAGGVAYFYTSTPSA